jgi:hypothetical protein
LDGVDESCIVYNALDNLSHFAPDITAFASSRNYVAFAPLFGVVTECLHVVANFPEKTYER